jgi:hypothetical protein
MDNGLLYASVGESTTTGAFVSAATLVASGMFEEFASCFSAIDPRAPLPVTLRDFKALGEGGNGAPATVMLSWSTTSEINSDRFEIEQSTDSRSWEKIGTVEAENSVSGKLDYSYMDSDNNADVMYYRLKMIDIDESFAYSRIESVHFKETDIVVYPNPVEPGKQLHLLLNDSKVDQIFIFDLSGKEVFHSNVPTDQINIKNLLAGRYILKIHLKDGSESNHVIIKR